MRKHWKLCVLLLCAFAAGSAVLFRSPDKPQPSYDGLPLSHWVEELGKGVSTEPQRSNAQAAIRNIGTNALPLLIKWMQYDPPRFQTAVEMRLSLLTGHVIQLATSEERIRRALGSVRAFRAFGPAAEGAAGQLNTVLTNSGGRIAADRAAEALCEIGTNGLRFLVAGLDSPNTHVRYCSACYINRVCRRCPNDLAFSVPALLRRLKESDYRIVGAAASALAGLKVDPATLLPALATNLQNPNDEIRAVVVRVFGEIGPPASSAKPLLLPLLRDPDPMVRACATNTLQRIAPDGTPF